MNYLRVISIMAIVALTPPLSHATTISCGPNICYQYDETQTAALYFGLPTRLGDSMRFIPSNFRAESLNGSGLVSVSQTWVFDRVYSVTGAEIGSVLVSEAGDYGISGDSSGTPDSVGVELVTTVANNASAEVASDTKNFSASGNTANPQQFWSLISTSINPASVFTMVASDVAVSVKNSLTATTDEVGGNAWIQKKFILHVGTVIPVPAAVWLFGSAFGVLFVLRRRAVSSSTPDAAPYRPDGPL
ncbi:MAG: VPLPA-CTERM sorting domain-containing protein [Gammaproteobacteria bacterium]|nr:VPLPA-CTERM sorting domain-containing protein [Gammaproteobacteria bacterium]